MAKVKFSALVSDMRNKLNGSVFSKNRAGSYLRNKVTPVNAQTVAQTGARAKLTTYAQAWRALTEEQRQAWNAAVSQWSSTDVFGDIKNPTGLQLYIRLNINVVLAGGAGLNLPPSPEGAVPVLDLSVDADVSDGSVVLSDITTPVPAGMSLYIEATPCLSPGINNANNQFRFIQMIPAAGVVGDVGTAYLAKFGALVAGQKIFVRCKFINVATGEVSQPLVAQTIVEA